MSKERRKDQHEHIAHGAELPDEHPGAIAQRRKRKDNKIRNAVIAIAIGAAVYYSYYGVPG